MNSKSKTIAQMAAALADDPKVEKDVHDEMLKSQLVSHMLAFRASKGLTQEQVASAMGCDPSKISRLESGHDFNLRWQDIVGYFNAIKVSLTITFGDPAGDPSLPAAERIKQCVFEIYESLERLTALAGQDAEIAKKIHQFSGEVLLNFLMKYKDHAEKLRSVIRLPARPEELQSDEKACENSEAEEESNEMEPTAP